MTKGLYLPPKTYKTMRLISLKSLLSFVIFTSSLSVCAAKSSDFHVIYDDKSGYTIITDTIELDANEYISKVHTMKLMNVESYRGGYICHFYYKNYTSYITLMDLGEGNFLLNIGKDGQDIYRLPIPVEYYEWNSKSTTTKVLNDTLFCFNPSNNFYWNEDARQWMATDKKMSNDCYEDDTYAIYSEDRGEWGDFTRFHEKQSGLDYLFATQMTTALKFEDAYYIVGTFQLSKVSDTHKGWEMNDSIKFGKWASVAPPAEIAYGTKYRNLYEYRYSDDHSQDTLFCSGFMRNGKMHFLVNGSEDTFIAKYKKGKQASIEKVLSLGNIPVKYSQGRMNQDELTLYFEEDRTQDGILNIDQDTIRITYINKHSDTLQYRGIAALEQVIDFAAKNTGKATLSEVKALEEKIGGVHDGITLETDWMGHASSEYQKKITGMDLNKIMNEKEKEGDHELVNYFHAIDEFDSFCVGYCYQKESKILTTVWIESYKTNFPDSEPNFRKKGHVALDSVVSKCLSVAPDSKGVWRKGDLTFRTFGSKNRIVVQSRQQ